MDSITLSNFGGGSSNTFYGKVNTSFIYLTNIEPVDNPGGNFLPIYLGIYTKPMDVEFEVFDPFEWIDGYIYGRYRADIYLHRYGIDFMATAYNLNIIDKQRVIVVKSPDTQKIPLGESFLVRARMTMYFMGSMF